MNAKPDPSKKTGLRLGSTVPNFLRQFPDPIGSQALQFGLGDVRGLGALDAPAAVAEKIASAEEFFSAGLVQDDAGIGGANDSHTDLQGQVGLDQSGQHGPIRTLRRQHQVYTGRPSLGCQFGHQIFKLFFCSLPARIRSANSSNTTTR